MIVIEIRVKLAEEISQHVVSVVLGSIVDRLRVRLQGAEDHYTHVESEFGCVGVDLWRTDAVADSPDYNGKNRNTKQSAVVWFPPLFSQMPSDVCL